MLSFGEHEGLFDNEQSGHHGNQRKQRSHGINVHFTSVRDASGRPRPSILFDVDRVGLPLLGSRLGANLSIILW